MIICDCQLLCILDSVFGIGEHGRDQRIHLGHVNAGPEKPHAHKCKECEEPGKSAQFYKKRYKKEIVSQRVFL